MQLFMVATTAMTVSTLHESLQLLIEDRVAIAKSSGKGGVVFSIPFPSGSCFCDLFLRGSLGLRIDFALFRLVLSVG